VLDGEAHGAVSKELPNGGHLDDLRRRIELADGVYAIELIAGSAIPEITMIEGGIDDSGRVARLHVANLYAPDVVNRAEPAQVCSSHLGRVAGRRRHGYRKHDVAKDGVENALRRRDVVHVAGRRSSIRIYFRKGVVLHLELVVRPSASRL